MFPWKLKSLQMLSNFIWTPVRPVCVCLYTSGRTADHTGIGFWKLMPKIFLEPWLSYGDPSTSKRWLLKQCSLRSHGAFMYSSSVKQEDSHLETSSPPEDLTFFKLCRCSTEATTFFFKNIYQQPIAYLADTQQKICIPIKLYFCFMNINPILTPLLALFFTTFWEKYLCL